MTQRSVVPDSTFQSVFGTPSRPSGTARALIILLLLVAFALRAWKIDSQSLWSDEAISLNRAALPISQMLASMPAEHAPAYFVGLRGWTLLTDTSDFALRFFSLLPGVFTVAVAYRLAADLAASLPVRALPAIIAAGLLAFNPMQIWYAQEARMYTWLAAFALTASWSLWQVLQRNRPVAAFGVIYAITVAACVYTHYFGILVPMAHSVYVVGWSLARRDGRAFLTWVAASTIAFVLFLPWLPRTMTALGFDGWRQPGNPAEIPLRFFTAFTVSGAMPGSLRSGLTWIYLMCAIVGAIWWLYKRRSAGWYLLALTLIPWLVVFLFALRNPDYHERYAITIAAPLLILVAGGLTATAPPAWRGASEDGDRTTAWWLAPALLTLALIVASGAAVKRQASDVTLHKPDYRSAVERISANSRAGDVILVDGPDPSLAFGHYYRGDHPVQDLRRLERAPADIVDERMDEATDRSSRAWEILFFHEPAAVQVWLATQAWATEPTWHNNIRVTLYALDSGNPLTTSHNLAFDSALTLLSSEVGPAQVRAGDILRVSTDWFKNAPAPDYKFSLRLVDSAGNVALTQDYVPQNWFAPTSAWLENRAARDQRGILIPPELPVGVYDVTMRLYDPSSGVPLQTTQGLDVILGKVEVASP